MPIARNHGARGFHTFVEIFGARISEFWLWESLNISIRVDSSGIITGRYWIDDIGLKGKCNGAVDGAVIISASISCI